MNNIGIFLLLSEFFIGIVTHPHYMKLIPNGKNVRNPFSSCRKAAFWYRVGHGYPKGIDMSLNQFGVDFYSNDHTWNVTLCQKDSDGDNITNGEELGDPDCIWEYNPYNRVWRGSAWNRFWSDDAWSHLLKPHVSHPGLKGF